MNYAFRILVVQISFILWHEIDRLFPFLFLSPSCWKANQKITTNHEILGDDDLLSLDLGDGDNSIGQMLLKIDFLQSEVGKLKSKLDRITTENAERISLAEKLDLPPPHSENGIERTCIASQSTTAVVPQTGATSYVDVPVTSGSIDPTCFEAYKPVSSLHNIILCRVFLICDS